MQDYAERSSAVAQFKPGMVFGDREVVSVAAKSVAVRRIGYADSVKRYKIKRDATQGDHITTNISELYASRAAATRHKKTPGVNYHQNAGHRSK